MREKLPTFVLRIISVLSAILHLIFAMPVIFLAAAVDNAPGLIPIGAFLDIFPISVAAIAYIPERSAGK